MLQQSIYHEAKSKMAFVVDHDKLQVRLRTGKDEAWDMEVILFSPYDWIENDKGDFDVNRETMYYYKMEKEFTDEYFDYWFAEIGGQGIRRVRYGFLGEYERGSFFYGARGLISRQEHDSLNFVATPNEAFAQYFYYPYLNMDDAYQAPKWARTTRWYQIFTPYFCNGDSSINPEGTLDWNSDKRGINGLIFGGDLKGATDKLDYIKELGCNGIYFNSMFKSVSSHKYDIDDYYTIDPSFGSNEDFKLFVEEAHKRGIKVILDGVFNHCGWAHPFFQDVLEKEQDSEYYDYFVHRDPSKPVYTGELIDGRPPFDYEGAKKGNYDMFAFNYDSPKWNCENQKVRDYLIGAGEYWIREYDIDGWRLDVSIEISHDFWREFKRRVDAIKEDLYLVGESWDYSYPWIEGKQFHGVMNYDIMFKVWSFAGENHIYKKRNASEFAYGVSEYLVQYPRPVALNMLSITACQDTARLMSVCGDDARKVKLLYSIMYFMPGPLNVYYGDECGITGDSGETGRKCMPWYENPSEHEIFKHIQKLNEYREENIAMSSLNFQWIELDDENNSFILKKEDEGNVVYLIVNNSENLLKKRNPMTGDDVEIMPFTSLIFVE